MAFPTFDPVGTIGFYRDVLGLPIVQTMQVKAWGPEYQRDFVHFFFDIGNSDCLAFFYYFGQEPYRDQNLPPLLDLGQHVAGFDRIAFFLQPLGEVALFHRGRKRGHQDFDGHWSRLARFSWMIRSI